MQIIWLQTTVHGLYEQILWCLKSLFIVIAWKTLNSALLKYFLLCFSEVHRRAVQHISVLLTI